MKAQLIAVGTELLLGEIANTNGAYLSRRLAEMGIDVLGHTVVGDNEARLQSAVRRALHNSDFVIMCGGLGPTTDDITKEAVANLLNLPLEEHKPTLEKLEEYFNKTGRELTSLAKKQALIPHGAIVFENDCGTAPGMCIESDKQSIIILPGPPREFTAMFEKSVVPYLKRFCDAVIHSSNVYIVGKGEPYVEKMVGDLIKSENPTYALYAKDGEVRIRVTAKASNRADAVKITKNGTNKLLEIFGDEIYGIDSKNIQSTVVDLMCQNDKTLTTAESLTGGEIAQMITSVPGASNVFKMGFSVYSDRAKHKLLGVKKSVLKKHTAVSEQTAVLMAIGALKKAKSDYAIATTGVAGPGKDSQGHEQGLVFVAVADKKRVLVEKFNIGHEGSSREFIREVTSKRALDMLRRFVISQEPLGVLHKRAKSKKFSLTQAPKKPKLSEKLIPKKGDGATVVFSKIARLCAVLLLVLALVLTVAGNFGHIKRIVESQLLQSVYSKAVGEYNPSAPVDENGFDTRLLSLREKNPDTLAWLWIDKTTLGYPVVQGEKYKTTNFYNGFGTSPYVTQADFRASMQNIVVNCEAQVGQSPFYDLKRYENVNFYKSHPVIDMVSVAGKSQWKVFAAFVASVDENRESNFAFYKYENFLNADELYFYVSQARSRSLIDTKVDVRSGDTLLTLAINSNEFEGAKFVVVARKVRRAETQNDEYKSASANLTALYPDEYYEKNGTQKPDFSALLGADDVMKPSEDENVETPIIEEIVVPPSVSVEDTSSESTTSAETSSESTSHETSSEEVSSEKPSSEKPSSTPVSSSKPSSSREQSSSRVQSSSDTIFESEEPSSEMPSSTPVSSRAPTSSETTSSEDTSSQVPENSNNLTVMVNGRKVTSTAFDLVCQIVANEIGNSSPTEALKAQAVAAHTYLVYYNNIGQIPTVGLKTPSTAVKNAVASVIDELVYYNGSPALTVYSAMSAGRTNSSKEVWGGHYPYLVSVESQHDTTASGYKVEKQYSAQFVSDVVKTKLGITLTGDPNEWFEVKTLTSGGYNDIVSVGGKTTYVNASGKTANITGRYLRESVLSLRSAAFDVEYDSESETFTFTTYGYGHGVGLSQWGAIYYAQRDGWDYKQILKHYYKGVEIK